MSENPQGPGWWQASDGRWYPPQPTPPPMAAQYSAPAPYAPPGPYAPGAAPPPVKTSSGTKGCLIAAAIVGGLLLLAGIAFVVLVIFGLNKAEDALDEIGNPVEAEDVELIECTTDESGFMEASVRVTNQSPERSNYFIEVSFDTEDGGRQLATAPVFVNSLDPGQASEQTVSSFTEAPDAFECRVGTVDRFSDET